MQDQEHKKVDEQTASSSATAAQNIESDDFSVTFASNIEQDGEEVAVITSEQIAQNWLRQALESFDPSNRQYSVALSEDKTGDGGLRINLREYKQLAHNAQNDLSKILKINALIRQEINEDDIIGAVHTALIANLNTDISFRFENLPDDYDENIKNEVSDLIKRFHKETNINYLLENSIPTVYVEGNSIKYLRSKNGHYVIDTYPLGVAIISDYTENGLPYVLIDIRELRNRLQKNTIRGKKNRPLFFANMAEEIKANYPKEIYKAFISKEHYAKLDLRRTGVNRICNLNRKYGLSPIFKAIKPNLMLDTFDEADRINAKAKAKKIIHQRLRKETMGTGYDRKGFEEMAYAHKNLMQAWRNPTVVYTSPPCVEKIEYIEPKVENTNIDTINQYRTRETSALGISFLNTDGNQTVSTASISIKQLMKVINKIAEHEEQIISRWYSIILEEHGIPQEYCPTPHIMDAELLEFEMRKDLAEMLFSKFNCSFKTAYELIGIDVRDEIERRQFEKDMGYDDILSVHSTAYNSSGNDENDEDNKGGRPSGSDDEKKQEYDKDYNETRE